MLILEAVKSNRLFEMMYQNVLAGEFFDQTVFDTVAEYAERYIQQKSLTKDEILGIYSAFAKEANEDAVAFSSSGQYPLFPDPDRQVPRRTHYDIILLFSVMISDHRYRIMQLIHDKAQSGDNALFVGCGPGIEIELVKDRFKQIKAYDPTIDPFIRSAHPKVVFKEEYFEGRDDLQFQGIYLIEILEHVREPYKLLEDCSKVLADNGEIYLTTATNMPQFDHLYNFESGHEDFEAKVDEMNLEISYSEDIVHMFITLDIQAKNRFYVLKNKRGSKTGSGESVK